MSITDELREWAHGFNGPWRRNEEMLLAIADRIDAKHEEKVSYWQGACYEDRYKEGLADNEDAMAEHGWVKLPVDADGVPIRVGDVMENMREDLEPQLHHRFRVYSIRYCDYGQECALTEDGYPTILYRASECRHYHEPTVEDVLREFVERWHDTHHDDIPALFAEYAAKLRLAEGEDA